MVCRERNNHRARKAGRVTPAAKPKIVAPISIHENFYFIMGSTKDAAAFQDMVQELARHVSATVEWKQDTLLGKAMTDLQDLCSISRRGR